MGTLFLYIPIGRDARLLERSIDHYGSLGVDRVLLDVHLRDPSDEAFLERVHSTARRHDAEVANVHRGGFPPSDARREEVLGRYCRDNDWVVMCDIDEFQEYPCDLHRLAAYCERHGYDYVTGRLLDRVSADGRLAPLNDRPLWHQFPAGTSLTANKCGGDPRKIVLARPWVKVVDGQHLAESGRGMPEDLFCSTVHHFKWDAEVLARCRYMRDCLKSTNRHWWREYDRLLRYLSDNGGRIDLSDPGLNTCWPAYARTEPAEALPGPPRIETYDRLPWALQPAGAVPMRSPLCRLDVVDGVQVLQREGEDRALKVNDAVRAVWELCDGNTRATEIIETLSSAFPGETDSIADDVFDILDALDRVFVWKAYQ